MMFLSEVVALNILLYAETIPDVLVVIAYPVAPTPAVTEISESCISVWFTVPLVNIPDAVPLVNPDPLIRIIVSLMYELTDELVNFIPVTLADVAPPDAVTEIFMLLAYAADVVALGLEGCWNVSDGKLIPVKAIVELVIDADKRNPDIKQPDEAVIIVVLAVVVAIIQ